MGVSKNRGGPPKSSILIGFSLIASILGGKIPLFLVQHPYDIQECIDGSAVDLEILSLIDPLTAGPDLSQVVGRRSLARWGR